MATAEEMWVGRSPAKGKVHPAAFNLGFPNQDLTHYFPSRVLLVLLVPLALLVLVVLL